jgi:hypothetical protein
MIPERLTFASFERARITRHSYTDEQQRRQVAWFWPPKLQKRLQKGITLVACRQPRRKVPAFLKLYL